MRRVLHIFLVFAVLWCGIHVGEPAMAHDQTLHHQLDAQDDHSNDPSGNAHEGMLDAAHSGHHHCPIATDMGEFADHGTGCRNAMVFPAAVFPLTSYSQAPPLEPPAA